MTNRFGIGGFRRALVIGGALAGLLLAPEARAEEPPARPEETPNALARRWFEDAKFGLFVHWGVYSLLGKGEWVMNNDKIPIAEYRKLPPQFNPTKFDAEEWVKLAKSAGVRYITVTTKHHDGFCMYDSKLTDYDVVDGSPYAKDPIKALADACRKHRIKLFFYYSLLDWHHPDYFPLGKTGHDAGREEKGDWSKYVAYYQGQVRELCTNYGEIGGLWFDGWWDAPEAAWDLEGTYKLIHDLQPGALVGNNHHVAPFPGEDFQMFEQDLPGENSAGFNKAEATTALPLETCLTMNESWGYNSRDDHFKSAEQIVRALAGAAGRGANLLLNVGPKPDGTIGPEFAERLLAVGRWLEGNGKAIYGTRKGPIPPQPWGVTTDRDGSEGQVPTIYLHILKPDVNEVTLPEMLVEAVAFPLGGMVPLKKEMAGGGVKFTLPDDDRDPYDTIISVTFPVPMPR
ncbi:alpha-L-fucosidase [Planctomyces sp. SH-PL62]|uniref:alpha-L-fucosidase n=1 Tax=Planctomyces sp. SH-PL62 TaxID=1636152 RepID=UPI00078BAFAD|nr:alpha-L-fucosidase [Planctomyces sp. SH-PL62]AMV38982.1 Alpha-L-fucosidase [Planctomyces sp. SH-PL62]